jgi:hypothetical protein
MSYIIYIILIHVAWILQLNLLPSIKQFWALCQIMVHAALIHNHLNTLCLWYFPKPYLCSIIIQGFQSCKPHTFL